MAVLDVNGRVFGLPGCCQVGIPAAGLKTHTIVISGFFNLGKTLSVEIKKKLAVSAKAGYLVGVPMDCESVLEPESPPVVIVVKNILSGRDKIKVARMVEDVVLTKKDNVAVRNRASLRSFSCSLRSQ